VYAIIIAVILLELTHVLSYSIIKRRILRQHAWDLNICCGKTDGGGINADIVAHAALPNMVLVDVHRLPFRDGQFNTILCSHTIEHVADPDRFFRELTRVGDDVTIVIPPLWDVSAALNVFEHRWIFLSFKKVHQSLPPYVELPLASAVQRCLGQRIHA